MTTAAKLRSTLVSVEADERFTCAVMRFRDGGELHFCHRVDERWAKAVDADQHSGGSGLAGEFLKAMTMFRLNAKHLDVQFADGSRWDERVPACASGQHHRIAEGTE